jgi:hypothetical protein
VRILAVVVLVLGFLVVWGGLTQSDTADFDLCPPSDETQGYALEPQWWPPGTLRCDVADGGEVVATNTTFPWRDYLTVVLVALAVAVFRPLNPFRWVASLLLAGAAVAVFFGIV